MTRRGFREPTRSFGVLLVALLILAGAPACRSQSPETAKATTAATLSPSAVPARMPADCANLTQLSLKDTVITSASVVPAAGGVPEYCKVIGGVETVILFEIALPTTTWNGNFFYVGGGGYNGNIPVLTHAIARGYAAAATDTGHRGEHWDASALYNNPQAQVNYAHRGAHLVTVMAKDVVKAYYDQPTDHSYFMGCSNGGKMGLIAAQRYPEDFDGVVVGGSVIDRTGLMMMFAWSQRALLGAEIPPHKVAAMEKASLEACDAADGLTDGLVAQPDKCHFDPTVLTCKGEDRADCLTPAQVTAWQKILDGPKDSSGRQLYVGYSPGHEGDYPSYVTGTGILHGYPSSNFMYMDAFMRWFAFGPSFDSVQFDYDKGPAALARFKKEQDADSTDLSAFQKRGGKLIKWNGWADHSTPPLRAIQYAKDVKARHGAETDDFFRLFLVPGAYHCSGGPGPNVFGTRGLQSITNDPATDIMAAVRQWVEKDVAPEQIIATKYVNDDPQQGVARTRPLCPYPQVANYTGSGSIDDAANFVCAAPGD